MMLQSLVIPEMFQHIICVLLLLSYTVCIHFSMAAPIPSMAAPIPTVGTAIPKWLPPFLNGCSHSQ